MLNDELSDLQEKYHRLRLSFQDGEVERKKLLECLEACKKEHKELRAQLEGTQQEAESSRQCANGLHNELFTLRGQVAAYKHCIAAMTGTEIPLEITKSNPF